MNRLLSFSTSLLLLANFISFSHSLDPRFSFRMLIKDDASADLDPDYQNDAVPLVSSDFNSDCNFEGKVFKSGDQWKSSNNSCQMCHCDQGASKCDLQECPPLNCKRQTVKLTDECCPVCQNRFLAAQPEKAGCSLSPNVFHKATAVWYPFMSPFGFDKCTVCTCLVSSIISSLEIFRFLFEFIVRLASGH